MASKLSRFLAELKRRKVYNVAAVYAAVGVAISIAVPDLFGAFGFPSWAAPLVIVVIVIGFPIALVLAWAYEVKPEEPREAEAVPAPVVATSESDRKSVVVLPFDNLSPDPGDAYFADGLTEELIAELSGIRDLRVISRTTAMKLKGSGKDVAAIGRELNVQFVLEGSVRKVDNDIRITAKLIDATTDVHLGAERYSGTMEDVFGIQERLARRIVDALKVTLTPEEDDRLAKPRITHPLAYECFLRAKQHLTEFTAEGNDKAIDLLGKALEIEGPNGLLYSYMGVAHTRYFELGVRPDEAFLEDAERWAEKAFELNPGSPGGHVVKGSVLLYRARRQEAVTEFKEALRSDPNNSYALASLATTAEISGHLDAARSYFRRLAEVDPMTEGVNPERSSFYNGEFEAAVEGYRVEWEMDPDNPTMRWAYGVCLAWAGHAEEACEILGQIVEDTPGTSIGLFANFCVAALLGDHDGALAAMTPQLEELAKREVQFSWMIGSCYAILGMVDEAVAWLRQAMNRGFINYPFLAEQEPFLRNIRSERQVQEVLMEIKQRWEAFEP